MARINASLPIQGEIRLETYSKRQAIVPVASTEPFSFSPRHTKQSTPGKQLLISRLQQKAIECNLGLKPIIWIYTLLN